MKTYRTIAIAASMIVLTAVGSHARDTFVNPGSIELSGGEVRVIQDVDYYLAGSISLRDTARLIIQSASLHFTESTGPDIWGATSLIEASDESVIEIRNSEVVADGDRILRRIVLVRANASSLVRIIDSTIGDDDVQGVLVGEGSAEFLVDSSTVSEVRLYGEAKADLTESTVRWAVGVDFSGAAEATLSGLTKGRIAHWNLPGDPSDVGPMPTVTIDDCAVDAWSIGIADEASITIEESHIARIAPVIPAAPGVIFGLRPGAFEDWCLCASESIEIPFRLHLQHTEVDRWFVELRGGDDTTTITDCQFSELALNGCEGTIAIAGCPEDAMDVLAAYGGSPEVEFAGQASISRGLELRDTFLTMSGNLSFGEEAFISDGSRSFVTRIYEILVEDVLGKPVPRAAVVLRDTRGREVRRETADRDGRCEFEVRFSADSGSPCFTANATTVVGKTGEAEVCLLGPTQVVVRVR